MLQAVPERPEFTLDPVVISVQEVVGLECNGVFPGAEVPPILKIFFKSICVKTLLQLEFLYKRQLRVDLKCFRLIQMRVRRLDKRFTLVLRILIIVYNFQIYFRGLLIIMILRGLIAEWPSLLI